MTDFFVNEYFGSFVRRGKELHCDYKFTKSDYSARSIRFDTEPGFNPLPSPATNENYLRFLKGTTLHPLAEKLGVSKQKETSITPARVWNICTRCVVEDIRNVGVAYIHRQHVILGVKVCYKHATVLVSNCPICKKKINAHRVSKFYDCSRMFEIDSAVADSAADYCLATFSSGLLVAESGSPSREIIQNAIESKLSCLGYGSVHNIDYLSVSSEILKFFCLKNQNGKNYFSQYPISTFNSMLKLSCFVFGSSLAYLDAVGC